MYPYKYTINLDSVQCPAIHKQPDDRLDCKLGERVTFLVEVDGANCTFQWQRNGMDIDDSQNQYHGAATAQITIEGVDSNCEGGYQCRVTNRAGSILSNSAQLTICKH